MPPHDLELADVFPLADIDGRSLARLLTDPSAAHRDAVVVGEHHYRAIRTPTHKYVHYVDEHYETDELYDLATDPDETDNLIDREPALAAALRDDLTGRIGANAIATHSSTT